MRMYYNNRKLALSIFWIILGAVLMVLTANGVVSDMYSGMGGALIGIGMLQVIRNLRYRTNSKYREKLDVELQDERNKYIRMKSWSWTGYIIVLVQSLGVVIAFVMRQSVIQQVLTLSVCLTLCVYRISYAVICRKY